MSHDESTHSDQTFDAVKIATAIEKRCRRLMDETAAAGGEYDTASTTEALTLCVRDARAIIEGE